MSHSRKPIIRNQTCEFYISNFSSASNIKLQMERAPYAEFLPRVNFHNLRCFVFTETSSSTFQYRIICISRKISSTIFLHWGFVRVEHIFFSIYRNIVIFSYYILLQKKNQLCFVSFFRNYTVCTLFNLVYEMGQVFHFVYIFHTKKWLQFFSLLDICIWANKLWYIFLSKFYIH